MSTFWLKNTQHIIDNHFINADGQSSFVQKCTPFQIEVIVRGYIAGNTSTSLWTHYERGERKYCGIEFPDGLEKNQKLEKPVVTPTTKGITDIPITREFIMENSIMLGVEWDFITEKALELFKYGQEVADKAGFILVDTKYEFGRTKEGRIILIDELHTCDSSRFWIKETYEERMREKKEPDKLDKDCIRDWIKSVCDPYNVPIPKIPQEIILKAYRSYEYFYNTLAALDLKDHSEDRVIILAGSSSDRPHIVKISTELEKKNIPFEVIISSAHRNTQDVLDLIKKHDKHPRLVWITIAGRSNALSGVVAANSKKPVIACPPFADKVDMLVNIHSTIQCPSNVPVMTILEPANVAIALERIFNL